MAFVRTKTIKGKKYRYLVESYREDGKVKQRTIEYLGAVDEDDSMVTKCQKMSFEEYLSYEDGTDNRYELVNGELLLMPPASFLHSDIVDFIADLIKAVAHSNNLDIKVKTGDVGLRTGINSSRIPDLAVIDGQVWNSYRRDKSAVIEGGLLLAVEVVSPGTEQIDRDYTSKVAEYQNSGVAEYWIVDPIDQKVTILVLERSSYSKSVFTGSDAIRSVTFPQLNVTVDEIISA